MEIERVKAAGRELGARTIVGAGGGKVLDTARAAAAGLGLHVVSKEPERPRRFHRQSGWGDRNRQLPGPRWDAHDRGEQTTGDTVVSAREEFERVETGGGESERPIVSLKGGTIPRDPVERRGRPVMTPLEGHMAGASKPITVYTNPQRSRRRVRDGALIHSGSRPVASS